jgi:ribosomal protein S13
MDQLYHLLDKALPFQKKNKQIDNFNLFQLFLQRYGLNKLITNKIFLSSGVHPSLKLQLYPANVVNQEVKYVFYKHEDFLDFSLELKMISTLKKNIELYNYKGSRYILKLPINGQRRRANGKTARRVRYYL